MDASIFFNLIFAIIGYLLYPIIWCISGKQYTAKQIKKRVIINGIVVFCIFLFLGGGNVTAAFLWSSIAYWMVKKKCLVNEDIIESKDIIVNSRESNVDTASTKDSCMNNCFCKKCGKELLADSSFCYSCGKRVRVKQSLSWKQFVGITIVVLIVVIVSTFSAFFIINYQNAVTSMNHQEFVSAKQYFDKIPFSEIMFPEEIEYINAGILMEKGRYTEALKAFKRLSFPVPSSVMGTVTDKIYHKAIKYYHNANYDDAKNAFRMVADYERSEDYLSLIRNRLPTYGNCNELIDFLDFEDTKSVLIENEICFDQFVSGEWRTQDGKYYFKTYRYYKTNRKEDCTYNLPAFSTSGDYYVIKNGIYCEGKQGAENRMQFKFSIIDKNTILVHCYKNNENYTLMRQ